MFRDWKLNAAVCLNEHIKRGIWQLLFCICGALFQFVAKRNLLFEKKAMDISNKYSRCKTREVVFSIFLFAMICLIVRVWMILNHSASSEIFSQNYILISRLSLNGHSFFFSCWRITADIAWHLNLTQDRTTHAPFCSDNSLKSSLNYCWIELLNPVS